MKDPSIRPTQSSQEAISFFPAKWLAAIKSACRFFTLEADAAASASEKAFFAAEAMLLNFWSSVEIKAVPEYADDRAASAA